MGFKKDNETKKGVFANEPLPAKGGGKEVNKMNSRQNVDVWTFRSTKKKAGK